MRIRIGTRGSRLALYQSRLVERALRQLGHDVELVIIKTSGDERRDRAFGEIGAPGVFVRAIEEALLEGRVDVAVHSHKDLPSASPEELVVAAIPGRADARDLLLAREQAAQDATGSMPLARGAVVGTASARRRAILSELRPDLDLRLIRGNLPTRMRLLQEGKFDATLLACAGIDRLREAEARADEEDGAEPLPLEGLCLTPLDPEIFVPAPAQGAIAVQVRSRDAETRREVARLDDPASRRCVTAERALLARVEGGCSLPFGAWCREREGELELVAFLATEDGAVVRPRARGTEPNELARRVWEELHPHAGHPGA